ncbi:hypothetical protein BJ322DRAFT_1018188 [Thelephora terrestris]|uniref:SnoaL-like domain-containing protein n=1 Tax=Thelephora terrestris TaxID=56493 RepID=A0A9P6LAJ8_9AGAM|nr:hypothetical protein BJ322DRAFT_1018188 [Thelephora terrestris]
MINIDATTPQLRATKTLLDGYFSRAVGNIEPLISKNFKYQSYPKVIDHPDETKMEHIQNWGPMFASFSSAEPTIHEVIEAPGKVVVHALTQSRVQLTAVWSAPDGTTVDYDSLSILSFVEEDGKLKVFDMKDFTDPEKRSAYHTAAGKALAGKGALVA